MLAAITERLERRVLMGEVDRYNVRRGICRRQSKPLAMSCAMSLDAVLLYPRNQVTDPRGRVPSVERIVRFAQDRGIEFDTENDSSFAGAA
jgi:hypothetical protein